MNKEIVVCLEGSPSSARATDFAIGLARAVHGTLIGLAVIDEPDIRAGAATGIGNSAIKRERDDTLVKQAEALAHEWTARFCDACAAAAVPVRVLERRGRPAATILEEGAGHDLTVMGQHANFLFETSIRDRSTLDKVVHQARTPVLVVPEDQLPAEGPVLLAYDGSSASRRALQSLVTSGIATLGPVHVVSVDESGEAAWETAGRAVKALAELNVKATPHNVVYGDSIAQAILDTRRKLGARILASGSYASSGLSHLIWGSVTRTLIENSTVPLLLQH